MSIKQSLDQDLKEALLGGDKLKSETLRVIKSVILNEEIAQNKRDIGLSDEAIMACLKKEVKKRQEAAELYKKVGEDTRAEKELTEIKFIEIYLPESMTDAEVASLVEQAVSKIGKDQKNLGQIIGQVKKLSNNRADGAQIAKLVKQALA